MRVVVAAFAGLTFCRLEEGEAGLKKDFMVGVDLVRLEEADRILTLVIAAVAVTFVLVAFLPLLLANMD